MKLDDASIKKLAQEIAKQLSAPTVQPVLLTVAEAATYTGRTEYSIRHLIAEGSIPVVREGRRVHLHRKDVDAWIEKNKY